MRTRLKLDYSQGAGDASSVPGILYRLAAGDREDDGPDESPFNPAPVERDELPYKVGNFGTRPGPP